MVGDNAVADREAEACAFADLFGGEERFEDLRHIFGRDADAGVLDLYCDSFCECGGAKYEFAAIGHCIDRISCESDHGLLDLSAVRINERKIVRCFDDEIDMAPALLVGNQIHRRAKYLRYIYRVSLARSYPAKIQKSGRDVLTPKCFAFDQPEI